MVKEHLYKVVSWFLDGVCNHTFQMVGQLNKIISRKEEWSRVDRVSGVHETGVTRTKQRPGHKVQLWDNIVTHSSEHNEASSLISVLTSFISLVNPNFSLILVLNHSHVESVKELMHDNFC